MVPLQLEHPRGLWDASVDDVVQIVVQVLRDELREQGTRDGCLFGRLEYGGVSTSDRADLGTLHE